MKMVTKSTIAGVVVGGLILLYVPFFFALVGAPIGYYVTKESVKRLLNENGKKDPYIENAEKKNEARKLISNAVKNKEISREKAEELLINLETNKITPDSIKAMFGEL